MTAGAGRPRGLGSRGYAWMVGASMPSGSSTRILQIGQMMVFGPPCKGHSKSTPQHGQAIFFVFICFIFQFGWFKLDSIHRSRSLSTRVVCESWPPSSGDPVLTGAASTPARPPTVSATSTPAPPASACDPGRGGCGCGGTSQVNKPGAGCAASLYQKRQRLRRDLRGGYDGVRSPSEPE